MDIRAINRRLDELQQGVERRRPCRMTVTYVNGGTETTDPVGAIRIFRDIGPFGGIASIRADRPEYEGLACTLTAICCPVPNRRIVDDE